MVVIAIISLLVSILLPSLNRAKELARRVTCASNLKQCGSAMFIYADENDGALPIRDNWSYLYRKPDDSEDNWEYVNCGLLVEGKYISEDMLRCPASGEEGLCTWGWGAQHVRGPYWYLQVSSSKWRDSSYEPIKIPAYDLWTKVLMSDYFLGREGYVGGFYHGIGGVNLLFADGSARWLADEDIYDYTELYKEDSSGWNHVVYCWGEYLEKAY